MSVFEREDVPNDLRRMAARRARLAISVVEHNLRLNALSHVADDTAKETMQDITRWIDEECAYVEDGVIMAAVDTQTLNTLVNKNRLTQEEYDELNEWLTADINQMYEDFSTLKQYVVSIDNMFDTDYVNRIMSVFDTHKRHDLVAAEQLDEIFSRYKNLGERELD